MSCSRGAWILQHGVLAGELSEAPGGGWTFTYAPSYSGPPASLVVPLRTEPYHFPTFPPFLEGLLPEGPQLEAILRQHKIDRGDCFRQLITVGLDLVGSLTVEEKPDLGEEPP